MNIKLKMNKLVSLLILILITIEGQVIVQPMYPSEFGGCFTPRKSLKVLMVCVRFNNWVENPNDQTWSGNSTLPTWAYNDEYLFDDLNDFNNISPNNTSISNYYYEMGSIPKSA